MAATNSTADVNIDPSGTFKYILLEAKTTDGGKKLLVRGYEECPYHSDIYDKTVSELKCKEKNLKCLGGGRIKRENGSIHVYGYSQGYGKADHTVTVDILKKQFADHKITWSDEGY
ncbi:14 kDa phosphohistidine phosphatase-like isoform X2 [Chrysoperla carnea]|nr:14 kDa phosphohistidine phosphatase-like isoform X2 [Chrysoperla carnea]